MNYADAIWVLVVFENSYENMCEELANCLDPCPFADVKCPTHISHGDKDADPPSHAYQAHEGIAGSELRILEGGWHVLELHKEGPALR